MVCSLFVDFIHGVKARGIRLKSPVKQGILPRPTRLSPRGPDGAEYEMVRTGRTSPALTLYTL